ncbi:hypothetical protein Pcinc_015717 [Petrolisthes cinctipes]|uniref:Sacsin n=1 Tax=Petrolisthes cinctipes TaxID=88211 RepID=A0AAE1KQ64_PETCI|nr:hypothetical protein Pcinc_015717 [Petrolisthes cinctipes]
MGKPSDWQCAWKADEYVDKQSALCSSHAKGKKTLGHRNAVTFAKPLDLYSSNFQELVGSTKLIVRPIQGKKHYKMQESVMILLGVTVDYLHLPLESVLDQLVVFSTAPHLDKIDERCHAIYDHLEKVLKLQPSSFSEFESLKNKNILLTKNHGFVEPGQFALSSESDCAPDLFSASMEGLDKYKLLMDALGITTSFSYNVVSKTILSKKDVCGKKKMSKLEVSQMSKLLGELFRVRLTNQVSGLSLHLPDTKGYLHPLNKLCFDDGSILSSGKLLCLHNNISVSKDMLTWLGILSKTQKRLEGSSRRMCFGQKEPLTTRLRNILQEYPCDAGIMKELLQNADDAGATEVKFIIDLRHLPTDKLFDKKYAPLQGPSLLVYNNKGFTANDLESIQNLGDSTKKEDPASTGQYGIGFNAVYHLTDAPSFLTKGPNVPEGSTICMFDPHCRYDPLATAESPGVRFTQLDELREDHPHSFMGYLEEQCLHKEGTVFRLPLRSSPNSDISKTVMGADDLIKLVMEIQTVMTGCMLFLKSVRKVTVARIDETGKWHQEYSVKSRVLKKSDVPSNIFRITQSNITYENLFAHEMLRDSYKMQITDDTKKTSVWLIVQQFGAQNKESIPDSMKEAIDFGYLRLLPHAGVALLLNSDIEAKENLYTTSCYLPLPTDSGLPFSINGHFALASSRQDLWNGTEGWKVTWNQWLMKEVLLPAAVFAIDKYRLSIFRQGVNYLDELDCQSKINSFQKHLPNMNDMKSAKWQWFTQKFYEHIKDNNVPFFDIFIPDRDHVQVRAKKPTRKGKLLWHALNETGSKFPVYFSDPRLENSNVLDTLKRLGMKISSDVMCSKLESANPKYQYSKLAPASALNFLTSWSKCFPDKCKPNLEKNVEETPFLKPENVLDLFQYISKELKDSSNVQNLPLLLTNDNVLRSFSNSKPVFNSLYCHLLPNLGKEFVNKRMVSEIKKHVQHFEQANVVKPFTIMDLRDRLPSVLNSSYHSQDAMVKLIKSGSGIPNGWWLQEVWKFVTENLHIFFHQIHPFSDQHDWTARREHILQTLGDWALYPVTHAGCIYLVPLNNAWRSLDVDSFEYDSPFRLLPIPQPYKFKNSNIIPANLNLAATKSEPQGVLKVLHFHESEIFNFITEDQLNVSGILEYLGHHCNKKMLCKEKISQLRIFINAAGQPCSLLNRKIIVPESVKLASMNKIALENGYVILMKPKSENTRDLYEYIQPGYLSTDLDIYSKFILLHLKHLEEEERWLYLETLKTSLSWNRPDVVSVLQNTEFIELDGRLVTANNFYDPSNPVFRVMKAANLPQIWSDRSWRDFLIKAGMIHTVTPNKYLKYARSLKASDPDVEAKSKVLVDHLNQTNCGVDMMSVVPEIRDIEFLLPYKIQTDLQEILPCFKTASGLVSFSQSVDSRFEFLVWSTASILPQYATQRNLLKYMNISNTPPKERAQQHITKFCQACSGANYEVKEKVMEKIYEYLETQSAICNALKQEEVPVVHIQEHKEFVCASQVIENLEEEILPYLYNAPIKYGKYYNVFQMMGMKKKASCDTYALVLARIYQSNMNHQLHPGEMHSMTMALEGMLKYEQHLHKLSVEVLYLPTKQRTLSKSSEMLVADNYEYLMAIESQLKNPLFLGFGALKIEKDNGDFVKRLPERLRPKFVSQMVIESLVIDGVEETFSPIVVQLNESLRGPAFKTGVLRVINHFKVKESVGMTDKEKQAITTKLSQVVVTELKEIKVSLKYCNKVIGSKPKCSHLEQQDNKMTLYLSQPISSNLQTELSITYSSLLNVKNIDVLNSLNIIFGCIMKPHDIHKRLDQHDIMEYTTQSFPCHFYSTDLGSYLDERFLHLLDNSFGDFHAGEIVCMEKYDLEDLEDGDEGRGDKSEEDNTFVIVKVLHLVEKSSVCKMMNIYEVSKGDEDPTFTVKAHRLYRFVREVSDSVIPFTYQQGETEEERKYERTEEELRKQIRKQVVEIWRVENERDRRSLLRRLMFEWHPDKNPLRKELCTRLFQYIQSLVGRLERGETIPEDDLDSDSAPGPSRAYNYTYSRSRFSSTFGGFSSTFGESSSTFGEPYFGRFTHQPKDRRRMGDRPESRKWWRHANHDLEEAGRRLGGPACYTIYICMQAAEKLLKACIYQVNRDAAVKLKIHSLTRLCQELNLPNVLELAQQLEAKVGNINRMRYPDFRGCPCDHYGEEDALFVLEKVRNLKQLLMPTFNF